MGFWHSQSYSFKGLGNNDLTAKTRPKRSREQNYTPWMNDINKRQHKVLQANEYRNFAEGNEMSLESAVPRSLIQVTKASTFPTNSSCKLSMCLVTSSAGELLIFLLYWLMIPQTLANSNLQLAWTKSIPMGFCQTSTTNFTLDNANLLQYTLCANSQQFSVPFNTFSEKLYP